MPASAFSRLADVLPEPLVIVTAAGVVEAINRAGRAAFPDADVGRDFFAQFDDHDGRVPGYLRACQRVRQPIPAAFTARDGRIWRVHGARYDSGEPARVALRLRGEAVASTRFLALNQKIDALRSEMRTRRRAEQALRREREWLRVTLMSIGDAVIATDIHGRIVLMNPVAQALTRWAVDDAVGRPVTEVFRIVDESSRRSVEDPVGRVLRDGRAVGLANHTVLIARDGTEWPIDDSAAPILDEDESVIGAVLVFHEIVERRKLEALQRERIEELEREGRLKDEFLAMLAHELRNPLAPLLTGAALLEGSPSPATVDRVRAVIDRQVRRLARLVDDLLDVSRITRGHIELRREVIDPAAIVGAVVEAARPLLEAQGHELTVELAEDLPSLDADAVRLEQIVTNLLSNAIKYTPPGGHITIEVRDDGDLVLAVRDSGVGIDPALLPRVFEPFVQGERSLDRSEGGLGVGLTLVKHLVELHGGSSEAHSAGRGHGAEIVVRLPAHRDAAVAAPDPGGTDPAPAALRVLIVDDQRDAADLLADVLSVRGYEVATEYDGPAALQRAMTWRPDVALLDIGLPGMDGYELARRLRRAPGVEGSVLIAITGYGQDTDRERSAEAGFDRHLLKPVDPEELNQLLAAVAEGRRP